MCINNFVACSSILPRVSEKKKVKSHLLAPTHSNASVASELIHSRQASTIPVWWKARSIWFAASVRVQDMDSIIIMHGRARIKETMIKDSSLCLRNETKRNSIQWKTSFNILRFWRLQACTAACSASHVTKRTQDKEEEFNKPQAHK